jgi:hypothetical protein
MGAEEDMKRAFGLVVSLLVAGLACAPGEGGHDAGRNASGGDVYAPGLRKAGRAGQVEVVLLEATPAPPDVGDNTWRLRVQRSGGAPLEAVTVVVTPFMTIHGHGISPPYYEGAPQAEAGTYEAGPFNLSMPGPWELTVLVEDGAEIDDEAVFVFDLEG